MQIRVKALRPFKEALGGGDLNLDRPEGETIEELIRALVADHPAFEEHALEKDGTISLTLNMMVSGKPVGEHDLSKTLEEGDELLLFMPLAGG
jgi:molybdopterin converting factor small subunit